MTWREFWFWVILGSGFVCAIVGTMAVLVTGNPWWQPAGIALGVILGVIACRAKAFRAVRNPANARLVESTSLKRSHPRPCESPGVISRVGRINSSR
jgi:hypothetical protein